MRGFVENRNNSARAARAVVIALLATFFQIVSPFNAAHASFIDDAGITFGTNEYLTMSTGFAAGESFTVEGWVKSPDFATQGVVLIGCGSVSTGCGNYALSVKSNSATLWQVDMSGYSNQQFTVPAMSANTWHHVAISEDDDGIAMWVDGIAATPPTSCYSNLCIAATGGRKFFSTTAGGGVRKNYSSTSKLIGAWSSNSWYSSAGTSISNLRFTAGAVYPASAATIVVPTAQLTRLPGTKLLLNTNTYPLVDSSVLAQTLTGISTLSAPGPTLFSGDATGKSVYIRFGAIAGAGSYTAKLYASNGTTLLKTQPGITSGGRITGLTKNTSYQISVTAISGTIGTMNSSESSKISITTSNPDALTVADTKLVCLLTSEANTGDGNDCNTNNIFTDASGNVYSKFASTNRIYRYSNVDGFQVRQLVFETATAELKGAAQNETSGNFYLNMSGSIFRTTFPDTAGTSARRLATGASFMQMTIDKDGLLYYSNSGGTVFGLTDNGASATSATLISSADLATSAGCTGSDSVRGIAVDADKNIFVNCFKATVSSKDYYNLSKWSLSGGTYSMSAITRDIDQTNATHELAIDIIGQVYAISENGPSESIKITGVSVATGNASLGATVGQTKSYTSGIRKYSNNLVPSTILYHTNGTFNQEAVHFRISSKGGLFLHYSAGNWDNRINSGNNTELEYIANVVPRATSISGNTTPASTLTARPLAFTATAYQWQRNLGGGNYSNIAGATNNTYLVSGTDVGYALRAIATADDGETITSLDSAIVSKQLQTITFVPLTGSRITTNTVTLSGGSLATSSSGLTPTYSSNSLETCTTTSAGVISLKLVGTCSIRASQIGSAEFGAATPVDQSFEISADVPAAPFINSVSTAGGSTSTSGTATINFTPGASNGAAIDSFTVYATVGGSTLSQSVLSGTGDSATVTGLTLGSAYTISVKAFNSSGASAARTYASTVTPFSAPYSVTDLRTTQTAAGTLRVNFTPPASLNGGTSAFYKYFITPSGTPFGTTEDHASTSPGGSTIPTDPNYSFTGLTPATAYDIKVVVSTTGGGSALESYTAVVSQIPANLPTAPFVGLSQIDSQTVLVQWMSRGDNGSRITSYTPSVTIDGVSQSCANTFNEFGSTCSFTGLIGGQVVAASVTATNSIGTSTATVGAPVTVIGTVDSPTALIATGGDGQISIAFTQRTNGDTVVYYRYSLDGSNFTVAAEAASPVVVTGLTNGHSYTMYLQAVGATNGAGAISDSVTASAVATVGSSRNSNTQPSAFVVLKSPTIARESRGFSCSLGNYIFKRSGGVSESATITSQTFFLLIDGQVVDSMTASSSQASFNPARDLAGMTISCAVSITQEGVTQYVSSLDRTQISALNVLRGQQAELVRQSYNVERDKAYALRVPGNAASALAWKKALDAALSIREKSLAEISVQYLSSLEKLGISILIEKKIEQPVVAPKPEPTKEVNVQPTSVMRKIGTIYFASGTYLLDAKSMSTLKALAVKIASSNPTVVLSYGHTDNRGGVNNTLLSKNRARAVAKLLRSLLPGQKLASGWFASTKPITTGTSALDLARNRRVEIYIK
jgi:outer membrane protein OmpA-like peptidoglycan-associated protein